MKKFIVGGLFCLVVLMCSLGRYVYKVLHHTYDVGKAVEYLDKHAASKSKGACAGYVRAALEAGGCPLTIKFLGFPVGRIPVASMYDNALKQMAFEKVEVESLMNFQPKKGDIVVFEAVKGHPYGHIAMYDGKQWVSDFRQRSVYVNTAYKKKSARFTVLRRTQKEATFKFWKVRTEGI